MSKALKDLIVMICPFGCNRKCEGIWMNEITGHRIICNCRCKHKETLARVWDPEANVIEEISSSQERAQENVIH